MEIFGKNSFTNIIAFLLKALCTVVVTRILLGLLGQEGYGFWGFLWSLYGYTLLFDFGMGWAVQKAAAEFTRNKEISDLNRSVATVFFTYFLLGLVIMAISMLAASPILSMFKSGGSLSVGVQMKAFVYFAIGTSLIFPTGLFSEILVGLKKHYQRNYVRIFHYVSNIIGVCLIDYYGGGVLELTLFTIGNHLFSNIILLGLVYGQVEGFSLSPKLFSLNEMPKLASFSGYAYIVIFNNLIILNTDQFLVGHFMGFAAVGAYQIGTRLSQFLKQFGDQFQEVIFPNIVSSDLKKNDPYLYLTNISRFSSFILQSIFAFSFVFADQILMAWLKVSNPEAILITQLSLCHVYLMHVFKSSNDKYLMGLGFQKYLACLSIYEIVLNLAASFFFIKLVGVPGACMGSIVTVFFSAAIVYPFIFHTLLKKSYREWFSLVLKRNNLSLLVALVFLSFIKSLIGDQSFLELFIFSVLFFITYLLVSIKFTWRDGEPKSYLSESHYEKVKKILSFGR